VEALSSRTVAEWMAYASIEPFGEERADLRAGIIASVIANVNRDPKKRREPFTEFDFMPRFGPREPTPQPDGEAMTTLIKAAFPKPEKQKALPKPKGEKKG
jgi:hypothetical protein